MRKEKLIPLAIIAILFVIGIVIVFRGILKSKGFDKLVVTYSNHSEEYDNVNVDDVIVVNNTSFWVISITKDNIILNSSDSLENNGKETNEFKIEINKDNKVCFKDDSCILFKLV